MDRTSAGWGSGLLGVIIFSGSLPATRLAVAELSPLFLTSARAAIAGLLGGACLVALRQPRPARTDLAPLAVVALGVVLGYPLLSALALQYVSAAHSAVFLGLLPLSTAFFGVLRGGERPRPAFWVFSLIGAAIVAGFALSRGAESSLPGDLLMLAGILVCGLGYAEGAALSRRLGGWQVISWALLLALVPMTVIALAAVPAHPGGIGTSAWAGLFYVSVFSMLVGFVFWYRGLALGGIARVSQLQLLQPFLTLAASAFLLGEQLTPLTILVALIVVAAVAVGRTGARGSQAAPSASHHQGDEPLRIVPEAIPNPRRE